MIDWQDLHHSDLSVSQLYALLQLRCAVFVVEQNCPYQDIDGDDLEGENRHILGWHNGTLVAYARILKSDDELQPVVIGRVIVSEALRGEKIGQQLMSKALESCTRRCTGEADLSGGAGAFTKLLWAIWFHPCDRYL